MNMQKNIAAKIRFAMMQRNCSLEELARELGIARSTLQEYLRENSNPRLDTLELLAEKLGYTPAELISDVDACQLHDLHHLHRLHPLLRLFAETVYVEVIRMSEALDQLDAQDDSLDELLLPRPQIPDALTNTHMGV